MDRLRKNDGITLIEILIASLLVSVVFLAVASSYTSGLRLLASTRDSTLLDPAMAMNAMSKNTALANQIAINPSEKRLTLRLDYNHTNGVPTTPKYTADTSDDFYIMYQFVAGGIHTDYGSAPSTVDGNDPEVIPGLATANGNFAFFNPLVADNSNAVTISFESGGRTLNTTVAAGASAKRLT